MKKNKKLPRLTEKEYGEYLSALKEESPAYSREDAALAAAVRRERTDRPSEEK